VLDLQDDADVAPLLSEAAATRSSRSRRRSGGSVSSKAALPRRRCGSRSRQRSVDSSAQVKSSGEPARLRHAVDRLRRAAVRELGAVGDVGRPRDLVLVPDDGHPVLREDDIRLDGIHSHRQRQLVGGAGVLGAVSGAPR
jgi:hypothetical protein